MISEKNIGYFMLLAIMILTALVFVHSLPFLSMLGAAVLAANAPIFIYFNRKSKNAPINVRWRHGVNVTLAMLLVLMTEVLFAGIAVGIAWIIKLIL